MIAIKLQNNVACEYICKHIQTLIQNYQTENNDMSDLMLVIDIKKPYDTTNPIKNITHIEPDLAKQSGHITILLREPLIVSANIVGSEIMETVSENIMLKHTIINIDNKCLDLLLTEDEIQTAFARALDHNNAQYINPEICCKCWPIDSNKECCPFWKNIFGLCEHCDDSKPKPEGNCNE